MKSKMEIRDTQVKVTKANLDGFEMDDEEDGAAESGEELSDDDIEKVAFQRAASHLSCEHKTHTLDIGEDPAIPVAAWFLAHFGR